MTLLYVSTVCILVLKFVIFYCLAMPMFRICNAINITHNENPLIFKRPGIGVACLYLIVEGIIFTFITLILEVCLYFVLFKV